MSKNDRIANDTKKPVYNVRIRCDLYEQLSLLAKKDGRSITNYINKVLSDTIDAAKTEDWYE